MKLGEYNGAHENIECKCKVCECEWSTTPNSLLKRRGCPKCATKQIASKLSSTKEELISRIAVFENNIEIVGNYKNANTKIECCCKKCGCEFVKRPVELLRGQGCPWCAGRKKSPSIIKSPLNIE